MATKTQNPGNSKATTAQLSRGKVAPAPFPRFLLGIAVAAGFGFGSSSLQVNAVEVSILTLDGREFAGDLEKIDVSSATFGTGESIPVAEIRGILFPDSSGRPGGAETVFLSCGSKLTGNSTELTDDEAISIQLGIGGEASFPIDAVRGVRLLPERKNSLFERGLQGTGDSENDRAYVPQGAELRELTGIVEEFSEEQVVIDRDGATVDLARSKVYGILFANAVDPDIDSLSATVRTSDGSILRGSIVSYEDGKLRLAMVESAEVTLPVQHLEGIRIQPPNLFYASDIEPASAVVQPVIAPARDWQRDRNISGGLLKLGSRTFEKGIGMASGTRIAFQNLDAFVTFSATVGIDADRGNRGDCEVVVSGDGQELARHRLRGGEAAVAINVDVSGVSEIILSAEPGADYDLSDHVNWCEASFLKR